MNRNRCEGLVALVTGAGSGIGQAAALELGRAGAKRLTLVGRRAAALQATAALLAKAARDCDVEVVAADLSMESGRTAVAKAVHAHGTLDCLVNNAGLFKAASLRDTSDQLFNQHLNVNVGGPLALIRDLVDLLAKSANASIVNISSTLAIKPIPGASAYNASKAALLQLSRSLALELGPEHIRVNCILPAIVDTPMYSGRFTDAQAAKEGLAAAAQLHPLGRIGSPEDIAHAIAFLASPAAAWITGIALPVDGGMLVT